MRESGSSGEGGADTYNPVPDIGARVWILSFFTGLFSAPSGFLAIFWREGVHFLGVLLLSFPNGIFFFALFFKKTGTKAGNEGAADGDTVRIKKMVPC